MKQVKPFFLYLLILICFLLFIAIAGWHKIVHNLIALLGVLIFIFYKYYVLELR